MTLKSEIFSIYCDYKCEIIDSYIETQMLHEIKSMVKSNWIGIDKYQEIYVYNTDLNGFVITISEDLTMEFENKYPEALL